MLGIGMHRPVRKAARIRCPILLIVAETDTIAPLGPALRVADLAPKSELHRSRGGHYGPYKGGEDHDNVIRVELEFLNRHAKIGVTFESHMTAAIAPTRSVARRAAI